MVVALTVGGGDPEAGRIEVRVPVAPRLQYGVHTRIAGTPVSTLGRWASARSTVLSRISIAASSSRAMVQGRGTPPTAWTEPAASMRVTGVGSGTAGSESHGELTGES
jgi:hypothetical protein